MSELIVILLCLIFSYDNINCASISFDMQLNSSQNCLELNCAYTLAQDEVLYQVTLKKDTDTFLKFNQSNLKTPQFTHIDGISDVKLSGGGKLTLSNYQNSTSGLYKCMVIYDKEANQGQGTLLLSKKKKLTVTMTEKCVVSWKDVSPGTLIPNDAIVFGTNSMGKIIACRGNWPNVGQTPGYWKEDVGCVFEYGGSCRNMTTFQVLCGSGFSWQTTTSSNITADMFKAGSETTAVMYLARLNDASGDMYLGKVFPKRPFYACVNNKSNATSSAIEIGVCKESV